MRSVLFEIGGFEIYSYGVMIALAFTLGILWAVRNAPREGIKEDHVYEILIMTVILAAFGSRLVYVARNFEVYREELLWGMLGFRDGGLVFHGGFIFAVIGILIYSYIRKINFFKIMDIAAIIVAIGYPIARVGCFLNGCCYGTHSDLPWAVVFPAVDDISRHPTQLYSTLLMAGALVLLLYLRRYKFFQGYLLSWFLILYGGYRFIVEFVRVNSPVLGGLTEPQLVSLAFMVFGALVIMLKKRG